MKRSELIMYCIATLLSIAATRYAVSPQPALVPALWYRIGWTAHRIERYAITHYRTAIGE